LLVKCKICSEKIDRDTAYKISVNNKNSYYCNEEEYDNMMLEKESRTKVINLSFEIIGNTTNTSLLKELKSIADVHSYTKTLSFLEKNSHELATLMSRNFTSEYGKIRYFTTIIKNKIADFSYKQEKTEVNNFEIIETFKYIPIKKKSFADFINEY